jgi:hypothetical protein
VQLQPMSKPFEVVIWAAVKMKRMKVTYNIQWYNELCKNINIFLTCITIWTFTCPSKVVFERNLDLVYYQKHFHVTYPQQQEGELFLPIIQMLLPLQETIPHPIHSDFMKGRHQDTWYNFNYSYSMLIVNN